MKSTRIVFCASFISLLTACGDINKVAFQATGELQTQQILTDQPDTGNGQDPAAQPGTIDPSSPALQPPVASQPPTSQQPTFSQPPLTQPPAVTPPTPPAETKSPYLYCDEYVGGFEGTPAGWSSYTNLNSASFPFKIGDVAINANADHSYCSSKVGYLGANCIPNVTYKFHDNILEVTGGCRAHFLVYPKGQSAPAGSVRELKPCSVNVWNFGNVQSINPNSPRPALLLGCQMPVDPNAPAQLLRPDQQEWNNLP